MKEWRGSSQGGTRTKEKGGTMWACWERVEVGTQGSQSPPTPNKSRAPTGPVTHHNLTIPH
ncbi:hypothetical protein E2C01_075627 [Portunus trituberculatus]|uniref:Uncharacterized protein n=1 Tax=Portunus trituberculatus TaxID=210409 RepID=A0A5B7IHJ4_PORTR|nr:hypothetical protein [Portunus trituberculatus]